MSEQHHTFEEDFDFISIHLQVQEKRGKVWLAHYWLDVPSKKVEPDVRARARKHAALAKKVTRRTQRIVRVTTHHVRKTMCCSTQEIV